MADEVIEVAAEAAPVAPVTGMRVELEGEFMGLYAVMDDDPPMGLFADLEKPESVVALMASIAGALRSWNFVDGAGKPLTADLAGLRRLRRSQVQALMQAYVGAFNSLPNESAVN